MISRLFLVHGKFCASRPWEVIIGTLTLTVCLMSMGLYAVNQHTVCGWNTKCDPIPDDTRSSDIIILSITRCLAVIYVYLQFHNLRKLGSKYLLGVAGVFTIFSSFIFSFAIVNIIGRDLTGLNEALPFFLLLVDLSKACTLAKFALSSSTQVEVVENVGQGMAVLGPALTLDALVETLVIGVGTMSGVKVLETMCCFGCLSVLANYLAFMTFYPACLALFIELSRGSRPALQLQQLAKVWQEEAGEKPNPVTQRVKIIMSAGLVFVHAHSHLVIAGEDKEFQGLAVDSLPIELSHSAPYDMSTWHFYVQRMTSLSVDYIVTLLLATALVFKYIFLDDDVLAIPTSTSCNEMPCLTNTVSLVNNPGLHNRRNTNDNSKKTDMALEPAWGEREATVEPALDERKTAISKEITDDKTILGCDKATSGGGLKFIIGDDSDDDMMTCMMSQETQTDDIIIQLPDTADSKKPRSLEECRTLLKTKYGHLRLSDDEVLLLVESKDIPSYQLERVLENHERGVTIRRQLISRLLANTLSFKNLPYQNYDYKYVEGSCCENVVGYMPLPVGVAGPLLLDGKQYYVPMATTEGTLVASTNRGCRALGVLGGVRSSVVRDGMTRAPLVRFATAQRASLVKLWFEDRDNYELVADAFNNTSRFGRLQKLQVSQIARNLYIRFVALTGDAMGMNMVSKGSEAALYMLQRNHFPDMEVLSISGNFCTDKKPCAINWIEGRGKSVVCEAVVPSEVVKSTLKTTVASLVDLNINKNLLGSIAAGSIGGFNAHAANIVTAIYLATGQDAAQTVCSSNCVTVMEATGADHMDLYISCTMPSIEVGTLGGGTILPPQAACLDMLGVRGASTIDPGANASQLARIVCATVLAGELSLMSALAAGHLVQSHMKHNRSVLNMAPNAVKDSTVP